MMNTHDEAPFSIAVALPTHLKSLVERMLHGLLREQRHHAARWRLSDAADADVTFRLHGEDGQAISPDLLAHVRCRDGRSETVVIEGAWRAGAMTAALDGIATMIVARGAAPATPPPSSPSALARQWLQRWCELRTQNAFDAADLNIGERTVARIDLRSATARYASLDDRPDAAALVAAMARGGWDLVPRHGDAAGGTGVSMKPLLWQLGLLSGEQGTLPALRAVERLRLKGWPYLAAGGHASFAELINYLRNGDNDRTSLQARGIAPRAVVDGFLNACFVCDFFHDAAAAAAPPRIALPPSPRNDAADRAAVSALRRTLGIARP
ncbi:MAG TPA: hypothetical protein VLF18_01020 [Tahibacter sp.]|uniref:hypothetical protein n=1 Tax=Tahibacter sp. TaxID=2056211 RepID=UPI002C48530E|nr:hypothetical protein [Tahibacter sp.]HSX58756.1 hypothetical protein [Tahibacter sp.]